jgi:hypothetical protein
LTKKLLGVDFMNKNCGCGGSSHSHSDNHCPPLPVCETAKSHGDFCTAGPLANQFQTEQTVILAQVPLHINVEADIKLPSPAQEIKHIRKNVFLTQCRAIPRLTPGGTTTMIDLFVEGFVHKNIQFSESCNGFVRDFSVNVPFRCFQSITLTTPGDVATICASQKSNEAQEIREMDKHGMGSDRCAFGSRTFENFNEPVECKLLTAEINEMDFLKKFDRFGNFNEVTEKMAIDLLLRLTQVQHRTAAPTGTLVVDCIL